MKAAPKAQRRLLDLQAIDTALNQLAHRRRSLPELAEIETVSRELSALEDERVRAQVAVDDLDRDITRFEKDIEQVRTRKDRDQARLDAGGALREIEGLQHELATLNRRQSELEDAELELMEKRETAERALNDVKARIAEAGERRAAAEERRDEAYAEIAKEQEFKTQCRAPLAADLPPDLIKLYDKIRADTGLGAALFRAGRCGGCRIELYGADLNRVKSAPADEVVRCEECRRIMVRTHGVRACERRSAASDRRGGRRVAGQPRPGRVRRCRPRRRQRRACCWSAARRWARPRTTSPSTGADRGPAGRRRAGRRPGSTYGWTPSWSSSRCPAAGRSRIRGCGRSRPRRPPWSPASPR